MNRAVRDLTIIPAIASILMLFSISYTLLFGIVLVSLTFKKIQVYISIIIFSFVNFMVFGFNPFYLFNLLFLPIVAIVIHLPMPFLYKKRDLDGEIDPHQFKNLLLGVISLLIFVVINLTNSYLAYIVYGTLDETLFIGIVIAVVNAVLVTILGVYLQRRLQKILKGSNF